MSGESVSGDRIVYTTKEILADIHKKLDGQSALVEQMDRRLETLERRVDAHDSLISAEIPKFSKFIEEMNVQKEVEAALDSRKIRGVSRRDRMLVGGLSASVLILGILAYIPRVFG